MCKIDLEPDVPLYKGAIYPTSPNEEKALKEYIDENLAKGFIRKSESPDDYLVLFVPKKSGELRLIMDYRKLNQRTKRKAYLIPRISSDFEGMKEAVVFSKFDLKSAYNLVRIISH
jgi:DNA primase large subunit